MSRGRPGAAPFAKIVHKDPGDCLELSRALFLRLQLQPKSIVPRISRSHAAITSDGKGRYFIKDLSCNGTFVNDATEPVGARCVELVHGDRLVLLRDRTKRTVLGYRFEIALNEKTDH